MRAWVLAAGCLSAAICGPARAQPDVDEARFRALFGQWQKAQSVRSVDPAAPRRGAARRPPARQASVTSGMGMRVNPVLGRRMFHAGADLRASTGTAVRATADGVAMRAGLAGAYGLLVTLRHQEGYETRYAHLSRILVAPGSRVRKGQTIGEVGSTGRSTGAHLHYEVRRHGRPLNPLGFMRSPSG